MTIKKATIDITLVPFTGPEINFAVKLLKEVWYDYGFDKPEDATEQKRADMLKRITQNLAGARKRK